MLLHAVSTSYATRDAIAPITYARIPELEVVQEVLNRRILGQTVTSAEVIPPGGPIVVRDLTGEGFAHALAGARFDSVIRRGKFLVFTLLPPYAQTPTHVLSDHPQAHLASPHIC